MKVKNIDLIVCGMLIIVFCAMLWLYDIYKNEQPQVGTAIGTQYVYASGLSDETKELVEDLRWKHYPFFYTIDEGDWTWEQSYPYIMFEDGVLYVVDEDVTWFIEMQRKEE